MFTHVDVRAMLSLVSLAAAITPLSSHNLGLFTRIGNPRRCSTINAVGAAPAAAPQVLSVFDPKTSTRVVLVGTMHFNPRSIALARDVVNAEAVNGKLRVVAVESCPTRWNATLEAQPAGSAMRWICDNEMQAAAEAGQAFPDVKIELVDQTIEETGRRVVQIVALTLAELVTFRWDRIGSDLSMALEHVKGEAALKTLAPTALLDPRLLLGAPLSFVRYPLSLGLKSPLLLGILSLIVLAANQDFGAEDTALELAGSLAFAAFETIVLGRVLLVALLEERNYVLARNIRKAAFGAKPDGTIVAVLGMAHLNGVAALLESSRIV